MCMHQKRDCECGKQCAWIFHRDDVLPEEVVERLYCPECGGQVAFDPGAMIGDMGWIIAYNMEAARFYLKNKGIEDLVTPEFLFDKDYCSWYGMTPTDVRDNEKTRQELEPLKKEGTLVYFNKLKQTQITHFEKLREIGWRKARS